MSTKKIDGAKRGRGRPPVPSKYDPDLMAELANGMVGRPPKYLSEAIRAALPVGTLEKMNEAEEESLIRRVRRHWRDNKVTLLQAAHQRARDRTRAQLAGVAPQYRGYTPATSCVSAAMRAAQEADAIGGIYERTEYQLLGGAYDLIVRERELARERARAVPYEGIAERAAREALGSLGSVAAEYLRAPRATDMLYGSPYRPRSATDRLYEDALRTSQMFDDLKRKGLL